MSSLCTNSCCRAVILTMLPLSWPSLTFLLRTLSWLSVSSCISFCSMHVKRTVWVLYWYSCSLNQCWLITSHVLGSLTNNNVRKSMLSELNNLVGETRYISNKLSNIISILLWHFVMSRAYTVRGILWGKRLLGMGCDKWNVSGRWYLT